MSADRSLDLDAAGLASFELLARAGDLVVEGRDGQDRIELRGKTVSVVTDERGAFCVALDGGPRRGGAIRAVVPASELFDGASGETLVDGDATGLVKTTLRIESPPEDVDLDRPSFRITATLGLATEDKSAAAARFDDVVCSTGPRP